MGNMNNITCKNQINIIILMDLYISTEVWSLSGLRWINYTYYSNAKEVKKLNIKSLLILTEEYCIKTQSTAYDICTPTERHRVGK